MTTAFSRTFREIGLKGLFRGALPYAIFGPPSDAIYCLTTEYTREAIQSFLSTRFPNLSPTAVDTIQAPISSFLANAVSLVPYVPAEVVASRMMSLNTRDAPHLMTSVTRTIMTESGYKGLFRGFIPSLAACSIQSSQWWLAYSISRRELAAFIPADSSYRDSILDFASGAIAGVGSTLFSHPFHTIATRIQTRATNETSMIREGLHLMRAEGMVGLFRGLPPALWSAAVGSAALSLVYQYIKRTSTLQVEGEHSKTP